ncbi:MAG: hypothetical protein RLZZ450_6491 [Pseudomonadota bacterium]|jgi:hypothetical protein
MLRVLLPSWRFFDDVAASPTLLVRYGAAGDELGPWRAAGSSPLARPTARLDKGPRGPGALFIQARGNLALAHHTLLVHLLSDVADLDDRLGADAVADAVPLLVSYRLVTRLARAELPSRGAQRFQFKLTVCPDADVRTVRAGLDDRREPTEDVLISQLHDA